MHIIVARWNLIMLELLRIVKWKYPILISFDWTQGLSLLKHGFTQNIFLQPTHQMSPQLYQKDQVVHIKYILMDQRKKLDIMPTTISMSRKGQRLFQLIRGTT